MLSHKRRACGSVTQRLRSGSGFEDMKMNRNDTGSVPAVTVLLPVLNGERWIAESLESLRVQTFQDFEVLLIDDGCTDNTVAIAQSMGLASLRVIQGPRQGVSAARALGVISSNSQYIASQDADDLSDPCRLEKQIKYMNANPKCVIVGSWARRIDENGSPIGTIKLPKDTQSIRFAMNFNCPFVNTSTFLRKDAVLAVGSYLFSSQDQFAEDYNLWSRMARLGELHNIQEPLISYRKNSAGLTGTKGQELRRSGCAIAIRTTEATLSRRLSDPERQLFSLSYGRHRRISVIEAFRLYRIMLRILFKFGFPPAFRGITWRAWLAPIVWIVRAPQQSTHLWENDEIPEIS